jgi:hypothetical protein
MMTKRTALTVSGIVTLITGQFFQPAVGAHAFCMPKKTAVDFFSQPDENAQVRTILQRSCGDCHSDNAQLPWYGHVSPVSWLIARHIDHGRQKLNFSDWPRNSKNVREDIADSIEKGNMPLPSYLLMHHAARLSPSDKETIYRWADQ